MLNITWFVYTTWQYSIRSETKFTSLFDGTWDELHRLVEEKNPPPTLNSVGGGGLRKVLYKKFWLSLGLYSFLFLITTHYKKNRAFYYNLLLGALSCDEPSSYVYPRGHSNIYLSDGYEFSGKRKQWAFRVEICRIMGLLDVILNKNVCVFKGLSENLLILC